MRSREARSRVLITDHVFDGLEIEHELLEPLGVEVVLAPQADEETLVELCQEGVDALLVCFAPVNGRVVQAAADNGCRLIARYGIGYDNVDVETASRNGIVVTRVPDYCLDEVADHALGLLLCAARGIGAGQAEVRRGGWTVPRDVYRLRGRRLALIGVGQIGARLAARAAPLGFEIVGFDPFLKDWPAEIGRVETFDEAIATADAISLHAPLTAENRHIIGNAAIAKMQRRPIVVNTARGGLVDLEAAAAALDDGRISALALDVVDPEPLPLGHPLRDHPRAIITPHMAFFSVEAERELQRRATLEVVRALTGEPPDVPVNQEAVRAAS
ncbi:MAG: C-terminal binding protein [Solirubrobacteraceae bacterium]|nr:C-terminal binding protein [Solirubrobacteraceae bacterium]